MFISGFPSRFGLPRSFQEQIKRDTVKVIYIVCFSVSKLLHVFKMVVMGEISMLHYSTTTFTRMELTRKKRSNMLKQMHEKVFCHVMTIR